MPELPWEMITRSQRAAAGLLADTVTSLVEMGKVGVTRPEEVLGQVSAMAAAIGDLAGSTARPLEFFMESQRQLAETMSAFAVLQRQLADVLETAATNHAAIVQALEMMTNPVIGVAHMVRTEADDEDAPPDSRSAGGRGSASGSKKSASKRANPKGSTSKRATSKGSTSKKSGSARTRGTSKGSRTPRTDG